MQEGSSAAVSRHQTRFLTPNIAVEVSTGNFSSSSTLNGTRKTNRERKYGMQMGAYYVRVIKSSKISYKLHEKQFRISISLLKFGVKLFFFLLSSS